MNDHSTRRRACARWLQVLPALSLAIGALGGLSAPVCPALGAAPEPGLGPWDTMLAHFGKDLGRAFRRKFAG